MVERPDCQPKSGRPCATCGAEWDEPCPYDTMTPDLLTGKPIGGSTGTQCDGDEGVCEACQ